MVCGKDDDDAGADDDANHDGYYHCEDDGGMRGCTDSYNEGYDLSDACMHG